jgi:hypothetical protein
MNRPSPPAPFTSSTAVGRIDSARAWPIASHGF